VHARAISPESVVVSWDAANDGNRWVAGATGVPVAGYIVSRNGAALATVAATSLEDQARKAASASDPTSIEYSVTAVDASGNRSAPAKVVVQLPGAHQPRALVIGAIVLLVVAGLIALGVVLYRRTVARAERLPPTTEPAREEPRNPAPVS
jgi:hypothetical protein